MWRKGNPFALLVGMQTGAATVESSMEITQKLKMDLTHFSLIMFFLFSQTSINNYQGEEIKIWFSDYPYKNLKRL